MTVLSHTLRHSHLLKHLHYRFCFWISPTVPHWWRSKVSKKLHSPSLVPVGTAGFLLLLHLPGSEGGRQTGSLMKPATRESSCWVLCVFNYSLIQGKFCAKSFWLWTSHVCPLQFLETWKNIKDYVTILSTDALLLPSLHREQMLSLKEGITHKAFFEVQTIEVQFLSISYTSMTILAANCKRKRTDAQK